MLELCSEVRAFGAGTSYPFVPSSVAPALECFRAY